MEASFDDRRVLPLRESAADLIVEEHLEKGGLTGPYFPNVHWDIENQVNQADQTRQLKADVADIVVWAMAGLTFRPTEGIHAGRHIEVDSSQIFDLSLTQVPGSTYFQQDYSLFLTDQDGKSLMNDEEGLSSFIINRVAGVLYLRDPFVIPSGKNVKCTLRILRNGGVKGRAVLQFFGTVLYGSRATSR